MNKITQFSTLCIKCLEYKKRKGGKGKIINGKFRFICQDCVDAGYWFVGFSRN